MADAHEEALSKICGDMDDMESKKMFDKKPETAKGVDITISVAPKMEAAEEKKEDIAAEPEDESVLPPFLRKKK